VPLLRPSRLAESADPTRQYGISSTPILFHLHYLYLKLYLYLELDLFCIKV
jgi:hypothetical protein